MDLNLLNNESELYSDECAAECIPFDEDLVKELKSAHGKKDEELEKRWDKECQDMKEGGEEYSEHIEDLVQNSTNLEDDNDDEYSSGEAIPTCNPWRD